MDKGWMKRSLWTNQRHEFQVYTRVAEAESIAQDVVLLAYDPNNRYYYMVPNSRCQANKRKRIVPALCHRYTRNTD